MPALGLIHRRIEHGRGHGRVTTVDEPVIADRLPVATSTGDEPLSVDRGAVDRRAAVGGDSAPSGRPTRKGRWDGITDHLGLAVAVLCSTFVFGLMNWPNARNLNDLAQPLLFLDTTPSGGDMGAHVWGPAYLRDNLLPQLRLSGWTPDWYAGFPAYQFYMVIPSLAIVALNAGFPWFIALPLVAVVAVGLRWWSGRPGRWVPANPVLLGALVVAAGLVLYSFPYGVAFKLVTVSGLVGFPLAAWAMGRLARAPEPVPAFLSLAAFVFLFDTNFTIYGGNITSTLAGEFAFSMSLCLSLLAIGLTIRGMDDDRWRARSAVVIALVALCHLIPIFFMVPALMLAALSDGRTSARAWMAAATVAFALVPLAFADDTELVIRVLAVASVVVVFAAAMYGDAVLARRSIWLIVVGPVAVALSAFWLLPFYLRHPYFNDMGWERRTDIGPALLTVPMKIALPVAAIGAFLAYARRERVGMIFAGTGVLFAAAVANLGEGPLWNARLLPFYYLSVYVLAAVGVAMVARLAAATVSDRLDRPRPEVVVGAVLAATVAVFIAVAMPLRLMPFGQVVDGQYRWLAFTNQARSTVPGWTEWNYSGYERKDSYAEYRQVVTEMDRVGSEVGCGRAMWEYSGDLDRYGTPMALMLLPFWTDSCIGSMEGLYFESSATTPFHFLNQSVLSDSPSRAQRDLPYKGYDIGLGVEQLQVMGVRYYMAQSDEAIAAADESADLTRVGEAQPFVVYEVADSDLVEGLDYNPVVVSGRTEEQIGEGTANRFDVGWVGQAVNYYNDPSAYLAMPAEDGPDAWIRQESLLPDDGEPAARTEVTNLASDNSSISFTVDQVGQPVLVKASYFPNWKADGADGPWRVGPNLMAVVPTSQDVTLTFGRTAVDLLASALTVFGLAALVVLASSERLVRRLRPNGGRRQSGPADNGITEPESISPSPTDEPSFGTVTVEPTSAGPSLEPTSAVDPGHGEHGEHVEFEEDGEFDEHRDYGDSEYGDPEAIGADADFEQPPRPRPLDGGENQRSRPLDS